MATLLLTSCSDYKKEQCGGMQVVAPEYHVILDQSKRLHQISHIIFGPALDDLTVTDTQDLDASQNDLFSGCRDAEERGTSVRSSVDPAHHQLVAFDDSILHRYLKIRACRNELSKDLLEVIRPARLIRIDTMINQVQ